MKQSMLSDYKGLNFVRENEYIPADKEGESVAKGLEYALADWSVAQVAKKLGKEDDYRLFMERAGYYRHYWDPSVRMLTEAGGEVLILSARNIGLTTIVKGMPGNMPGLSLTMSRG